MWSYSSEFFWVVPSESTPANKTRSKKTAKKQQQQQQQKSTGTTSVNVIRVSL